MFYRQVICFYLWFYPVLKENYPFHIGLPNSQNSNPGFSPIFPIIYMHEDE